MKLNLKTLSTLIASSFIITSCGSKEYKSKCISVTDAQSLIVAASDFDVNPKVLDAIKSRDLSSITSYSREFDHYYFKKVQGGKLNCGFEESQADLIQHEFHFSSNDPELISNILVTHSTNGKIIYVSFSTLGEPSLF